MCFLFFSLLLLSSRFSYTMERYVPGFMYGQTQNIVDPYQEAKKLDAKEFGGPGKATAAWFKHEIVPKLGSCSYVGAQKVLDEVAPEALMAHLKHEDSTLLPMTLFFALPKDIAKYTVRTCLFNGDKEGADIFNAYAEKQGIGKAFLCYGLVHGSKGIPGLSRAQSVGILCSSAETYLLCKRLMPELMKQEKNIKRSQEMLNKHYPWPNRNQNEKEWRQDRARCREQLLNKTEWAKTQDIYVTNHELCLLGALPTTVKKQVSHNYVRPQISLRDKAIAAPILALTFVGGTVLLPTFLFGAAAGQRAYGLAEALAMDEHDLIPDRDENGNIPFSAAFYICGDFVRSITKAVKDDKRFGFHSPMKIENALKGLKSDPDED